jgi:hypothetical protein
MIGNKKYRTKQFTVTVEHHSDASFANDLKDFKWVRIYANVGTVDYLYSSQLLLGCESGREPASVLIAKARQLARTKLNEYKERAKKILEVSI